MPEATVLWEDGDFRAVDKPIGTEVEAAWPGQLIHRLDRPVSGVLLLGLSPRALAAGRELFAGRAVRKLYWAVTAQPLPGEAGELRHWLEHRQQGNKTRVHGQPGPGRAEAQLAYRRLTSSDRYHLYEVLLGTGRTHQIRAQLAAAGAPVRGDLKYGSPRSLPGGGIALLARSLSFRHPFTGTDLTLVAPVPAGDRLWAALASAILEP